MKIRIGDVVKLNSGGPLMTITQIGLTHGRVECTWFVEEVEIRSAFIHTDALTQVSDTAAARAINEVSAG